MSNWIFMTDENPTSNPPTHPIGTLTHTVRRAEIIEHLTNFRIEVDRAIHALPGILMGVSCAGVIQASIHLNWHIEHLRGNLIETMLREGYNPLRDGTVGMRPSQQISDEPSQANPIRGAELSNPLRREQMYTLPHSNLGDHLLANVTGTETSQGVSFDIPANQNRTNASVHVIQHSTSADQVVPESSPRGLTNGYPSSYFRSARTSAFRSRTGNPQPSSYYNHLFANDLRTNVDSFAEVSQERAIVDELSDSTPHT
jgi:hypothetical protein